MKPIHLEPTPEECTRERTTRIVAYAERGNALIQAHNKPTWDSYIWQAHHALLSIANVLSYRKDLHGHQWDFSAQVPRHYWDAPDHVFGNVNGARTYLNLTSNIDSTLLLVLKASNIGEIHHLDDFLEQTLRAEARANHWEAFQGHPHYEKGVKLVWMDAEELLEWVQENQDHPSVIKHRLAR